MVGPWEVRRPYLGTTAVGLTEVAPRELGPQLTQESALSSQRPSFVEGRRPILNERCMSSLKPRPQLLRVDRAQVLAGTGAQRTLKPNQIICRTLALLGGLRGPPNRSDVLPERSRPLR